MTKRSNRTGVASAMSVGGVAALLVYVGGCGTDGAVESEPGSDAESDAAVVDARADRRSPSSSSQQDSQASQPASPLPGWKVLTDYDRECGFSPTRPIEVSGAHPCDRDHHRPDLGHPRPRPPRPHHRAHPPPPRSRSHLARVRRPVAEPGAAPCGGRSAAMRPFDELT